MTQVLKSFDQLDALKNPTPEQKTLNKFKDEVQDEIIDIIENGDTKVYLVVHDDMPDDMFDKQDSLMLDVRSRISDQILNINTPDRVIICHRNGKTAISFDYMIDDENAEFANKCQEAVK